MVIVTANIFIPFVNRNGKVSFLPGEQLRAEMWGRYWNRKRATYRTRLSQQREEMNCVLFVGQNRPVVQETHSMLKSVSTLLPFDYTE